MTFPTIHLNGTSRGSLLETHCAALSALRYAQDKLCEISPNTRDYCMTREHDFTNARNEHRDRLARIATIISEIEAIAEHIADS